MNSPIMNPTNIAHWWDRSATYELYGREDVAAALWRFEAGSHDCRGEPDPHTAILSVPIAGPRSQIFFGDGKQRYKKRQVDFEFNIVQRGVQPRAIVSAEQPFDYLHFYLPQRLISATGDAVVSRGGHACELVDPEVTFDAEIAALSRSLLVEMLRCDALTRLKLDVLAQDAAIVLVRRYSTSSNSDMSAPTGGLAPWQVRRACDALDAAIDQRLRLDDLATLVGLSPAHFSRMFKRSTGFSPSRWIERRRAERAMSMLADPRYALAEIALAVGFSAQAQFTTAFKRETGLTPGQWRRERLT